MPSYTISDDSRKQETAELTRFCYDSPQDHLESALQSRKPVDFWNALQRGADPDLLCTEGGVLSVFEVCCQRSGHSEFVQHCIRAGCDVNKVNAVLGATAVHFAAESEDPENLRVILYVSNVQLDRLYEGKTALSQLTDTINNANFAGRLECIRLLLTHKANPNVPNDRGQPPILDVLRKAKSKLTDENRERLVMSFLILAPLDIDTHWDGKARALLIEKFPKLALPDPIPAEQRDQTDAGLLDALRTKRIDRFMLGIDARLANGPSLEAFLSDSSENGPIAISINFGLSECVEKLMRHGAKFQMREELQRACFHGYHKIVQLIICHSVGSQADSQLPLSAGKALLSVIPHIGLPCATENGASANHAKCFELLMSVPGISLAERDVCGSTALHLALQYKQRETVRALLRAEAPLGIRNKFGTIAIKNIDPEMLGEHFDECIRETATGKRPGDETYELAIRYVNLLPGIDDETGNEMTTIAHIVNEPELKHLAKHPLVASFLTIKWYRLALLFYLNFVCFAIFCASLIAFILCRHNYIASTLRPVLFVLVLLGIVYMVVREMIMFVVAPRYFVQNFVTFVAVALIALSGLLVAEDCGHNIMSESMRRTVSSVAILLSVGMFFTMLGSLPGKTFSTHLVMLMTVSGSFLKSLVLYAILLVAFALCFCMLLGRDAPKISASGNEANENGNDDDQFNKFESPGLAIVKTVVMLTGEFDASGIDFERNNFSYVVFVAFVFLVSTVLFNLLNGLAVNDTQVIKSDAELTNLVYRANLFAKYEQMLGQGKVGCFSVFIKNIMSTRINVFPHYLGSGELQVLPNKGNKIRISVTEMHSEKDGEAQFVYPHNSHGILANIICCCGLTSFTRMESRIVREMQDIIDRRHRRENEMFIKRKLENDAFDQRLKKIENNIDMILSSLNELKKSIIPPEL